jgi:hypothetical protein
MATNESLAVLKNAVTSIKSRLFEAERERCKETLGISLVSHEVHIPNGNETIEYVVGQHLVSFNISKNSKEGYLEINGYYTDNGGKHEVYYGCNELIKSFGPMEEVVCKVLELLSFNKRAAVAMLGAYK